MNNKFVLVGVGPHAKRIYLKLLKKYGCDLQLIIDLKSKKEDIENALKEKDIKCPNFYYLDDDVKDNDWFSKNDESEIIRLLKRLNITHAIISTEPKAHYSYAKLFLKQNINIILDKPLLVEKGLISSTKATSLMLNKTKDLYEAYLKVYNKINFSLMCQRRYNSGYIYIKNLISNVKKEYNLGINSIYITSCDGMWNMPDEFFYRENHPYKYGYGKLMHSGYHQVDLLLYLLQDIDYDKIKIKSSVFTPKDFFKYIDSSRYDALFHKQCNYEQYMEQNVDDFGELDFHSLIEFKNENYNSCIAELQLLQSGFSRRAWTELPYDTYKGNGRIKHEFININIGPLVNIKVLAFQAKNNNEDNDGIEYGQNNNFEIQIYRNSQLIGEKTVEIVKLDDLIKKENDFVDYNDSFKEECFKDFINNRKGKSDLLSHYKTMELIKKLYDSTHMPTKTQKFEKFELNKYLLTIDSEGTLRKNQEINVSIENSLQLLDSNNFIIAIASGLPNHIINRIFKNKNYIRYMVISNGSYILDNKNKKVIGYYPMDQKVLEYLCKYHEEYNYDINVTIKDNELTTSLDFVDENIEFVDFNDILFVAKDFCQIRIKIRQNSKVDLLTKFKANVSNYKHLTSTDLKKYEELLYENNDTTIKDYVKYLLIKEFCGKITDDLKDYISIGNCSPNFEIYNSDDELTWFSINKKGINKGTGLEKLAKYLNVPMINTIAVGNDYNDISMLNKAYLKFCLSNKIIKDKSFIFVKPNQMSFLLTLLESFINNHLNLNDFLSYIKNVDFDIPFLGKITDSNDVLVKPLTRYSARGFLKSEDKIAVFFKERINEFKLPGGGILIGETPTQAFEREIFEETGCLIENVKLIGYIEENKSKTNFRQISFIFTSTVKEDTGTSHLTFEEKENDSKVIFRDYESACKLIAECKNKLVNFCEESLYQEQFLLLRDEKILKYFEDKKK